MTDKQIIDGVDVSGCINYTDELKDCSCRLTYAPFHYRFCEQTPNCYYKQLARKEQEVQQAMDNYVQLDLKRVKEYNELVDLYKAKEQECEELKEELHQNFKEKDGLHLIIDRLLEASGYDTNTASAEDFEDVYENMRYEKQQLDRYKQTFTEIKKIAEGMHDLWINKTPYTDMDNLIKHLLECELNRIRYKLDEISECEVENENS